MILKRNIKPLPVKHVPLPFYRLEIPHLPAWIRTETSRCDRPYVFLSGQQKCLSSNYRASGGLLELYLFKIIPMIRVGDFPRAVHWDLLWPLTLGQVFHQVMWSSPISMDTLLIFIPPVLRSNILFICHRRYTILAMDSVIEWHKK